MVVAQNFPHASHRAHRFFGRGRERRRESFHGRLSVHMRLRAPAQIAQVGGGRRGVRTDPDLRKATSFRSRSKQRSERSSEPSPRASFAINDFCLLTVPVYWLYFPSDPRKPWGCSSIWLEPRTVDPEVAGSSPVVLASYSSPAGPRACGVFLCPVRSWPAQSLGLRRPAGSVDRVHVRLRWLRTARTPGSGFRRASR